MSDVFISYSRRNNVFARQLIDRLNRANKDSWVDWEGIPLTAPNWWSEIKAGIENADSFIFIMSPDSMASVVCNMELDYALDLRKRIIPVVYQDIESREAFASIADFEPDEAMQQRLEGKDPLIIARDNWQRISHINWIFFREDDDFDSAFDKLVETVETDLEYVKSHTRYLTRAQEWEGENRRSDLLLFGAEIERAEAWLVQAEHYAATQTSEKVEVVNPLAQDLHYDYIQTSRSEEQRRQRVARGAQISIAVLVIVAIMAGVISFNAIGNSNAAATDVAQAAQDVDKASTRENAAIIREGTAEGEVIFAQNTLTQIPPTLQAVATQIRDGENTIYSLDLIRKAEDVYPDNSSLGLALAYEANLVPNPPPAAQLSLGNMAYIAYRNRFEGHFDAVTDVAISADGKLAVSGSCSEYDDVDDRLCIEGEIIIWEINTGKIKQRFKEHAGAVESVAISPDGQLAVSASCAERNFRDNQFCAQGEVIVWDIETGAILHRFLDHSDMVSHVVVSADGQRVISNACRERDTRDNRFCVESEVIVWDIETGAILRRFLDHSGVVTALAFSPDGQSLLAASCVEKDEDNLNNCVQSEITLWDIASGRLLQSYEGHSNWINDVTFNPDGQQFVSASCAERDFRINTICERGEMILWETNTGSSLDTLTGHSGEVSNVDISADGQLILSASCGELNFSCVQGQIILWDFDTGRIQRQFDAHTGEINRVLFRPNSQQILSASSDMTLLLWDISDGSELARFERSASWDDNIVFGPNGETVLVTSGSRMTVLLDISTGKVIRQFEGDSDFVYGIAISPDGKQVITSSFSYGLLWDVASGELLNRLEGHESVFDHVVFNSDGTKALSGSFDATVILWDITTGELLQRFEGHTGNVNSVAFSPDGKTALSGSNDATVILWDIVTGELLQRFEGHTDNVNSVAFSPDGKTALSGSSDGTLVLWDITTGEILRRFEARFGGINSIDISPDGKMALSGSTTGTVILWDIAAGEILRRFERPTENIFGVDFSPDGQQGVSISGDGKIVLWRIDNAQQLLLWTADNRYVPVLDCEERISFGLGEEQVCLEVTVAPSATIPVTRTAFPVPEWTAIASPTAAPTLTSKLSPSPTPTSNPTKLAMLGDNQGEILSGESETWVYEAEAGDVLNINVIADIQSSLDILDTLLIIRASDGTLLAENDDAISGIIRNSRVAFLVLPEDGHIMIDVYSSDDESAGKYTLVIEQAETVSTPGITSTAEN